MWASLISGSMKSPSRETALAERKDLSKLTVSKNFSATGPTREKELALTSPPVEIELMPSFRDRSNWALIRLVITVKSETFSFWISLARA
ncbi:MAG: hypothetical protein DDT18_00749 [Actinobacteria bacterium]|nr:hypothetical protein [Actinomycetota bacterium]